MPPAPKPPALIYALIAKSNQPCDQKASGQVPAQAHTILVEVTEYKGNFTRFSLECLQKLAGRVKYKCKFDCGEQTFSFLVEDGYGEYPSVILGGYIPLIVPLDFNDIDPRPESAHPGVPVGSLSRHGGGCRRLSAAFHLPLAAPARLP